MEIMEIMEIVEIVETGAMAGEAGETGAMIVETAGIAETEKRFNSCSTPHE